MANRAIEVRRAEIEKMALTDIVWARRKGIYTDFGPSEQDAKNRVVERYVTDHDLLLPTDNRVVAECEITVGPAEEINFSGVFYCLGVKLKSGGEACGAHILADDNQPEDKAKGFVSQVESFVSGEPEEMTFVSAHLEETEQHRVLIGEFRKRYPNAKVVMVNRERL